MISESLKGLVVPLESIDPDPKNARKHNPRNLASIKQSLERFGQTKPVVVGADGKTIIAGNGTWQAARELGWTHIAAAKTKLKDGEAIAYGIADNRTSELAEWDSETLADLVGDLDEDLQSTLSFNDKELGRLLGEDTHKGAENDNPNGFLQTQETYEARQVRVMTFFFEQEVYVKVVERLDQVMSDHGLDSHAEAIEFMCTGEVSAEDSSSEA